MPAKPTTSRRKTAAGPTRTKPKNAKTPKPAVRPAAAGSAKGARPAAVQKAPASRRPPAAAAPLPAAPATVGDGWVAAEGGYSLGLRDGALVCRNAKGKELGSVPPKLAESPVGEQMHALVDWLEDHRRDCLARADAWMLRSLPVPLPVVAAVWPDPAWRAALENTVVCAASASGAADAERCGFLRGADPAKGVGVVTLDGETRWIRAAAIVLPHPVLIADLDDWRELAAGLALRQGVQQLLREVHVRSDEPADATSIARFANGEFDMLAQVTGRCRQLGYPVRGGYATCTVHEGGGEVRASYWIGSDDPQSETTTGELSWNGADDQVLPLSAVGPIAFSEGMRMASAIYAKRKVAETKEGA